MTTQINLRSLISMDNEPQYLLQAFQGSMIVTTNEYIDRERAIYENEEF